MLFLSGVFVFSFSFSRSRTAQVTHAIFGWLQHWRETQNDLRLNLSTTKGEAGGGRAWWVGGWVAGETTNGINSRQTAALQCPPCRWGTSYWWAATGPHTADGRGAYKVGAWPGDTAKDSDTLGISFHLNFPTCTTLWGFSIGASCRWLTCWGENGSPAFDTLTGLVHISHNCFSFQQLLQPPVQGALMAFCPV